MCDKVFSFAFQFSDPMRMDGAVAGKREKKNQVL